MRLVIREETPKIVKEEIKHLPTKEEFYRKMDEVMGELQTTRDEQTVMRGQIENHEEEIETIKTHLKISPKN